MAEAELQRDVRATMRRMAYSGSGAAASRPGAGGASGGGIAMVFSNGETRGDACAPILTPVPRLGVPL